MHLFNYTHILSIKGSKFTADYVELDNYYNTAIYATCGGVDRILVQWVGLSIKRSGCSSITTRGKLFTALCLTKSWA